MNSLKNIFFLVITIFLFSCVQNLDFNQIEEYSTTPTYTTSVTYFSVTPEKFVNPTGTFHVTEIEEIADFRIFENTYIKNNLVQVDFNVEVNNELDRDFIIEFDLLDDNNNLIYKFENLKIEANELNIPPQEVIDIRTNQNVKNTTRIRILIRLDNPTIPLNPNDNSQFEFKSSATLYLETEL